MLALLDNNGRNVRVMKFHSGPDIQSHRAPTNAADECSWGCASQLAGRQIAHSTLCQKPSRPLTTGTDEGGTRRLRVGAHRDRECWAAGAAVPDSRGARCARTSPRAANPMRLRLRCPVRGEH
jgi:hypothetical protein